MSNDHIEVLKTVLSDNKPPYCAGTLPLSDESLLLFYRKAGDAAGNAR